MFLAILGATIAGGILCNVDDQGFFDPSITTIVGTVLLVLGGWAVSLCVHEFGHAIVAYRGGDREVYFKGYLTLDPRRYTDPVLSLVLPLVFLLIGGIPLPGGAVWINHHSLRNKRVESAVSLAGPLSNLFIGALLAIAVSTFELASPLGAALSVLALFQMMAFVLNILPIPGLDGWGVIEPWLSREAQQFGAKARPWAPLILFAVLIGVPEASNILFDVSGNLFETFGGSDLWIEGYRTFKFWNF